MKKREKKNS